MPNNLHLHRLCLAACTTLILGACAGANGATDIADDALPPCSVTGTPFEGVEAFVWSQENEAWSDLTWSDVYHEQVSGVIEEYREAIGIGAGDSDDDATETVLLCTGEDYNDVVPAGPKLTALAETLQIWKEIGTAGLSAAQAGMVLMEYLREYECAMRETDLFLRENVAREMREIDDESLSALFSSADVEAEARRRQERLNEELRVARPALERTLILLSGAQRLHPLIADIECIERASLDLRNALSLLTGAASCMGRGADALSPLRF